MIQNGTRPLYINCLTLPCPVVARCVRVKPFFNFCFLSGARTITGASTATAAPQTRTPSAPKTREKNGKGIEAESGTAAGIVLGRGAGRWQATTRRGAGEGAGLESAEIGTEAVGWRREMVGEGAKGKEIQAGTLMMAGIVIAIPVICARRVLGAAEARRRAGARRKCGRRQRWQGGARERSRRILN